MSEYTKTQLKLLDCVNEIDIREKPNETIFIISLHATYNDEDVNEVKDLAQSHGYYYRNRTTYHGNHALKFVRREKTKNWEL